MDLKNKLYVLPTDELIDTLAGLFRKGMCLDMADISGKRGSPGVSADTLYLYEAADHALDRVDLDALYANAEKLNIPEKYPEFYDYLHSLQIEAEADEHGELELEDAAEDEELEIESVPEETGAGRKALYDIVNGEHTGKLRDSEKWVEKDRQRQKLTDEYNEKMRSSGAEKAEVRTESPHSKEWEEPAKQKKTKNQKTPGETLLKGEKNSADITNDLHMNNAGDVTHVVKGKNWDLEELEELSEEIPGKSKAALTGGALAGTLKKNAAKVHGSVRTGGGETVRQQPAYAKDQNTDMKGSARPGEKNAESIKKGSSLSGKLSPDSDGRAWDEAVKGSGRNIPGSRQENRDVTSGMHSGEKNVQDVSHIVRGERNFEKSNTKPAQGFPENRRKDATRISDDRSSVIVQGKGSSLEKEDRSTAPGTRRDTSNRQISGNRNVNVTSGMHSDKNSVNDVSHIVRGSQEGKTKSFSEGVTPPMGQRKKEKVPRPSDNQLQREPEAPAEDVMGYMADSYAQAGQDAVDFDYRSESVDNILSPTLDKKKKSKKSDKKDGKKDSRLISGKKDNMITGNMKRENVVGTKEEEKLISGKSNEISSQNSDSVITGKTAEKPEQESHVSAPPKQVQKKPDIGARRESAAPPVEEEKILQREEFYQRQDDKQASDQVIRDTQADSYPLQERDVTKGPYDVTYDGKNGIESASKTGNHPNKLPVSDRPSSKRKEIIGKGAALGFIAGRESQERAEAVTGRKDQANVVRQGDESDSRVIRGKDQTQAATHTPPVFPQRAGQSAKPAGNRQSVQPQREESRPIESWPSSDFSAEEQSPYAVSYDGKEGIRTGAERISDKAASQNKIVSGPEKKLIGRGESPGLITGRAGKEREETVTRRGDQTNIVRQGDESDSRVIRSKEQAQTISQPSPVPPQHTGQKNHAKPKTKPAENSQEVPGTAYTGDTPAWESARTKTMRPPEQPTGQPVPDTRKTDIGFNAIRTGNQITTGNEETFTVGTDGTININGTVLNVYGESGKVFVGHKWASLQDNEVITSGGQKFRLEENGKFLIEGHPGLELVTWAAHSTVDIAAPGRRSGDRVTVKINGRVKTFTVRSDGTINMNGTMANIYNAGGEKVWIGWKNLEVHDGTVQINGGKTVTLDGENVLQNTTGLELELHHNLDGLKKTAGGSAISYSGKLKGNLDFRQDGNVFTAKDSSAKIVLAAVSRAFAGMGASEDQLRSHPVADSNDSSEAPNQITMDGAKESDSGPSLEKEEQNSRINNPSGRPYKGKDGKNPQNNGQGPSGKPEEDQKDKNTSDKPEEKNPELSQKDVTRLLKQNQILRTLDQQGRAMHVMMGNDVIRDMYDIKLSQENIHVTAMHYDDILAANCKDSTEFARMNVLLERRYLTDTERLELDKAAAKMKALGLTADPVKAKKIQQSKNYSQEQKKAAREYAELYEKTREKIIKDGILVFSDKNKNSRIEHMFFAASMMILVRENGLPTDEKALKKLIKDGKLTEEQAKIAQNAVTTKRAMELYNMSAMGLQTAAHETVQGVGNTVRKGKMLASRYMGDDYTMRGLLITASVVSAIVTAPVKAWKAAKKTKALAVSTAKTVSAVGRGVGKVSKAGFRTVKKTAKGVSSLTKDVQKRQWKKVRKAGVKMTRKAATTFAKTTVKTVKMAAQVIVRMLTTLISALLALLGPIVLIVLFILILIFGIVSFMSDSGETVYYDAGNADTAQVVQEMVDVLTLCHNTFRQNLSSGFGGAGSVMGSTVGNDLDASGVDEHNYPQLKKGDSSNVQGKYNVSSGSWWNWEFAFDRTSYGPGTAQHTLHQMIVSGQISKSNNGGYLFLNNSMYAAAFTQYWGNVGDVLKVEFDKPFTIGSQPATNVMYILIVDTKNYDHTGYPADPNGLYGHNMTSTLRDFAEFTTYDGVNNTDSINMNTWGIMPMKATNMGSVLDGSCDMATIGAATASFTNVNADVYYMQEIDQDVYREIINRDNNIYYTFPEEKEPPEGLQPTPSPTPEGEGEIYAFYNNDQELISMVLAMFDFDINNSTSVRRNTLVLEDKSGVDDEKADGAYLPDNVSDKINDDTWRLITYFDEMGMDLTEYQEGGYDDLKYSTLVALFNASHIVTWNPVKEYHKGPDGTINPDYNAEGRIIGQHNTDGMSYRVPVMETTTSTVTNPDGTVSTVSDTHYKVDASGDIVYETHYSPCPGHVSNVACVITLHFDSLLNIKQWWEDNIYSVDDFDAENPDYSSDDPAADNYKAKEHVLKNGFQKIKKPDYYIETDGTCSGAASSGSAFNAGTMTEDQATVARTCYNYLTTRMGLTSAQAIGVLVNMMRECDFNYTLVEVGSGAGYGLCQWTGGRRTMLMEWCNAHPLEGAYNTIEGQLSYLNAEFTIYTDVWAGYGVNGFRQCTTEREAGEYFIRYFERPLETYMYQRLSEMDADIATVKALLGM